MNPPRRMRFRLGPPAAIGGLMLALLAVRAGAKEVRSMDTPREVRHITVFINRPPEKVYAFASNPENLPRWATGLGGSIKKVKNEWIADSPMGRVKVRFAEKNAFGVLDHQVHRPGDPLHRRPRGVQRRRRAFPPPPAPGLFLHPER